MQITKGMDMKKQILNIGLVAAMVFQSISALAVNSESREQYLNRICKAEFTTTDEVTDAARNCSRDVVNLQKMNINSLQNRIQIFMVAVEEAQAAELSPDKDISFPVGQFVFSLSLVANGHVLKNIAKMDAKLTSFEKEILGQKAKSNALTRFAKASIPELVFYAGLLSTGLITLEQVNSFNLKVTAAQLPKLQADLKSLQHAYKIQSQQLDILMQLMDKK